MRASAEAETEAQTERRKATVQVRPLPPAPHAGVAQLAEAARPESISDSRSRLSIAADRQINRPWDMSVEM